MKLWKQAAGLVILSSLLSLTAIAQVFPTQADAYTWQGPFPTQPHRSSLNRDAAMARVCWEEAKIDGYDECAAFFYALKTKAEDRHISIMQQMHAYVWPAFTPDRRPRNRMWIAYLHQDLKQPYFWPSNLSWDIYQSRWQRLIAFSHELWAGNVPNPCNGLPMDWADRRADHRINVYIRDYPNAVEINCGEGTKNRFFRIRP